MPPRNLHPCPVPNCQVSITQNMFLCRMHWPELPEEIREDIVKNYKFSRDGRNPPETRIRASMGCMAAKEAALQFFRERP